MHYLQMVDSASSQPGDLVLSISSGEQSTVTGKTLELSGMPPNLIQELWGKAEAESCGLIFEEFGAILASVGAKLNYGAALGVVPDAAQRAAFFHALHLSELALAHSCALGHEIAWQRFIKLYRTALTQAAIAITGSATLGHDLADSLYAELYGLRQSGGERRSPLASYSGRGSLLGWLRTTLAQRYVDYHRRTRRETPLDNLDVPTPALPSANSSTDLSHIASAVKRTLDGLPAEDRFLLSAYYLDRQTLLQIAHTLRVHEATISRRIKRLLPDIRSQLLHHLQSGGLSKRAAEEALGTDPRDVEINLRALLQTSQTASFSGKTASAPTAASDSL